MTDNAIIKSNGSMSLGFVAQDPARLADRLALMITNGKKLQPEERLALAEYAVATGLNPFAGECYFLSGVGPGPGIAGWRVKAEEQLEYEAQKTRTPGARFWTEYVDPGEGECRFDPAKGDIAVKAILHDTITRTEWEKRTLGHYIDLIKAGLKDGAWDIARELAGPEPVWSAVGVVRGAENFGPSEKMDRYERTCKRAEKAAIRKRFPRVSLPEPMGWDETNVIEGQMRDITPRPAETIIAELGYEPEPEKVSEPMPPADDPAWTVPPVEMPDDAALDAWRLLVDDARSHGLTADPLPANCTLVQLREAYGKLQAELKAKNKTVGR